MKFSRQSLFRRLRRRGIVASILGLVGLALLAHFWLSEVMAHREHFMLYFRSNIHGLTVGAPVMLNGQHVGQVSHIEIVAVPGKPFAERYCAAVTITLDTKTLLPDEFSDDEDTFSEALPRLLKLGLRGRLRMPSMLANGLCVSLYFAPEQPENYLYLPGAKFPEIPTNYRSTSEYVDQINAFIETKNLREISEKIRAFRERALKISAISTHLDYAELNATILETLEKAAAELNPKTFHRELAEFNAKLDEITRDMHAQNQISEEQLKTLNTMLKKFSENLRDIREKARELQTLSEPTEYEPSLRFLQELRNRYAPVIDLGKTLIF